MSTLAKFCEEEQGRERIEEELDNGSSQIRRKKKENGVTHQCTMTADPEPQVVKIVANGESVIQDRGIEFGIGLNTRVVNTDPEICSDSYCDENQGREAEDRGQSANGVYHV